MYCTLSIFWIPKKLSAEIPATAMSSLASRPNRDKARDLMSKEPLPSLLSARVPVVASPMIVRLNRSTVKLWARFRRQQVRHPIHLIQGGHTDEQQLAS